MRYICYNLNMRKLKIEWNKVTWYSKALAAAIFIILPVVAFYLGLRIGYFMASIPPQVNIYLPRGSAESYRTYENKDLGFSLQYPASWVAAEYFDQYTLLAIRPLESAAENYPIKVYLQKNSYGSLDAMKAAIDKRLGAPVDSSIKHEKNFDALVYGNVKGSMVMYVPFGRDVVLGITGPDDIATAKVLDSFRKL